MFFCNKYRRQGAFQRNRIKCSKVGSYVHSTFMYEEIVSNESEAALCKLDFKKIKTLSRWYFIALAIDICNTEINPVYFLILH